MISDKIADILGLMGYSTILRSGKLSLVDSNNQTFTPQRTQDYFQFSFEKDGVVYVVKFNEGLLKIQNNKHEGMVISRDEVSYSENHGKTGFNKSFVVYSPQYLSFYHNDDSIEDIESSTSYSIYANMKRMKKSTSIKSDSTVSEDITIEKVYDIPTAKHIKRKVNNKGIQVMGSVYEEYLNVDVPEYIKEEICSSDTISTLIQKMDTMIPGITKYYSGYNPALAEIVKSKQEKKTTN